MIIDLTSELTGTPDCEQPALTALTETPNLSNLLSNIHSILLLAVIALVAGFRQSQVLEFSAVPIVKAKKSESLWGRWTKCNVGTSTPLSCLTKVEPLRNSTQPYLYAQLMLPNVVTALISQDLLLLVGRDIQRVNAICQWRKYDHFLIVYFKKWWCGE